MRGYLPHDYEPHASVNAREGGRRGRTWTSCALTGFVATTLRAGAEEWKDLADDARRPLARDFLSIAAGVERRMSRATMGDAEGGGVEGSVCV